MSTKANRKFLIDLLKEKSLKLAPPGEPFTLASGQKSTYFIDVKKTALTVAGAYVIADLTSDVILGDLELHDAHYFGGVALGGCSLVVAASLALCAQSGITRGMLFVRKEAKNHGTKQLVEGPFEAGRSVTLLEDVITTGGSTLAACDALEAVGLKISSVIAVVDRLQGGRAAIEARGYYLTSLVSIDELL